MIGFTIVHILLVAVEDFPRNMAWIIHGQYSIEKVAVWLGLAGLGALTLHVWATIFSLSHRCLGYHAHPQDRGLEEWWSRRSPVVVMASVSWRETRVRRTSLDLGDMARTLMVAQ